MKSRIRALLVISLILSLLVSVTGVGDIYATATRLGFDNNDIIYMVLTDRFADGDSTNNGTLDSEYRPGSLKYYQGGDWQGVIDNIQYIKNLGVTAIWISPPQKNEPLSKSGDEAGYHGYFTNDYTNTDPHFGSKEKLQELVQTAHANGIKVILDAVPNHTADYLEPFATTYSSISYRPAAPFNNPDWFHHNGNINDYNDYTQLVNNDMGGLDDIDQSNTDAKNALLSVYQTWIDDFGFDAIRVDATSSMPKSFLQEFESGLGVNTFGEVFNGSVDFVSDYQNYQWGVLDFPLFFNAREVFAKDASFSQIKGVFDQDYKYKDPKKMVTFLDNHDRDRFLCVADDNYRKLRLGMTFLFTARGIPDVYYGTEQACYGGGVPLEPYGIANKDNRDIMPSFNQDNINFKHIQRLTQIRKEFDALRNGTQREMWSEDTVYSYSRRNDSTGDEVITILNNGWDSTTKTIPLRIESSFTVGTVLTNLMNTSQVITVTAGGATGRQITVNVGSKDAVVMTNGYPSEYIPQSPVITKIRVHYNAGFGNYISLRGGNYPLWWDQGRKMRNVSSDVWEYEIERIPSGITLEFKALLNDSTWQTGNNCTVTGGQTTDIYPTF